MLVSLNLTNPITIAFLEDIFDGPESIADGICVFVDACAAAGHCGGRNAFDRKPTESLSADVGDAIKASMAHLESAIRNELTAPLHGLEARLRQEVVIPIQSNQDRLALCIAGIPSHVVALYAAQDSEKVSHLVDKLHALEKQGSLHASALTAEIHQAIGIGGRHASSGGDQVLPMLTAISVAAEKQNMHNEMARETMVNLYAKVGALQKLLDKQSTSQSFKGKQGEDMLFNLLCERLTSREDYSVHMVSGQAHSCDINVKRKGGYPDIRIESKAIGKETGEKVRTCEVEKFRNDLVATGSHGIFVSLYSGIVGKGKIGIEQLANGKVAVYLSDNAFDINTIHDMIVMLYKLNAQSETDSVHVSPHMMKLAVDMLSTYDAHIISVRKNLKESLSTLNAMSMDKVLQCFIGQQQGSQTRSQNVCQGCGKSHSTAGGLKKHKCVRQAAEAAEVSISLD